MTEFKTSGRQSENFRKENENGFSRLKKKLPLLFLPFFWACQTIVDSVHEFPESAVEPVQVKIDFHFTDDTVRLEDYKTVDYLPSRASQSIAVESYAVRYTLEIEDKAGNVIRMDSVTSGFQEGAVSFIVNLPINTEYRTAAWVERVNAAAPHTDLFYNLKSLDYIQSKAESLASLSNDGKDAFTGVSSFSTAKEWIIEDEDIKIIRDTVNLFRPLAKFKLVATGLGDYYAEKGRHPVSVKLIYEEGVPLSYFPRQRSLVGDTDYFAATGWVNTFERDDCTLTFDWVFALDTETNIPIRVEVYDADDKLITRSSLIEVPLLRNALTIVKGRFLSNEDPGGGMGIDDRFDGEIVIELGIRN